MGVGDDNLSSCYGPHASMLAAKASVDEATAGRFATKCGTRRPPSTHHGPRQYLECLGAPGTCKWSMFFECTKDETTGEYAFYLWKLLGGHAGHKFLETKLEKMSEPSYRQIPARYLDWGSVLSDSGVDCADIHRALCKMAEKEGVEVKWELKDVQNKFVRTNTSKTFDAQGLQELLEKRKRESDLDFRIEIDGKGRLGCVVAEIAGGRAAYARDGEAVCTMLDTTHGTNVHDMKLALSTGEVSCVGQDHVAFD